LRTTEEGENQVNRKEKWRKKEKKKPVAIFKSWARINITEAVIAQKEQVAQNS